MRKASQSKAKIAQFLKKAVDLHTRGRNNSINLELEGKRILGHELENLTLSEKDLKFFVKDEHFTIKIEEVVKYKRLRTQKYLFFVDKKSKEEVAEEKPVKKAKKKAKSEEQGE